MGKLFNTNNTSYITGPCLHNGCGSPRNQPMMYTSYQEAEHVENIQPKQSSSSWKKLRDVDFAGEEDGVRYFDQQCGQDTQNSAWDSDPDVRGEQGMGKASQETLQRPQFQVTIEKPVGQFLSVSQNSSWRHSRRASDGAILAPLLADRDVRRFGGFAEETAVNQTHSQVRSQNLNGHLSTAPLARNRRVSVDCLSPRVRKISVVVPQPRHTEEKNDPRKFKSNENLTSTPLDSEDTSWRELVAKAKGFRTSKSAEPAASAEDSDFILRAFTANATFGADFTDGRKLRLDASTRRLSESSSRLEMKTRGPEAEVATQSGSGSERSSTMAKESLSDSEDTMKRAPTDAKKKTRRFSVATVRPTSSFARINVQKVSGYSTHGTLEYARQLLGKLQTEGRSKSKKERLDELSKALKWILEELNRIEVPDRDLVSVFISLRAKIVNLKAEVKAEETDLSSSDLESMERMPQLLTASEDKTRNVYSRRFSWCWHGRSARKRVGKRVSPTWRVVMSMRVQANYFNSNSYHIIKEKLSRFEDCTFDNFPASKSQLLYDCGSRSKRGYSWVKLEHFKIDLRTVK